MALNLAFVFKINEDGSQTVVVKQAFDHALTHDELDAWKIANTPTECGNYQFDIVNSANVHIVFSNQPDYADAQWAAWQSMEVGDTATPDLAGTYWNDHVTVEDCQVPVPTTVPAPTTTVPVPTTTTQPPPPPVPTSTTVASGRDVFVPVSVAGVSATLTCEELGLVNVPFGSEYYHAELDADHDGFACDRDQTLVSVPVSRELAVTGSHTGLFDPSVLLILALLLMAMGGAVVKRFH